MRIKKGSKTRFGQVTAIAAIVLLTTTGVASAQSVKATDPIQKGQFVYCDTGNHPEAPVLGTVKLKRTGNLVSIKTKLTGLAPNTTYSIQLFAVHPRESCPNFGTVVTIATNAKGNGRGAGAVEVPAADTEFELGLYRPNGEEEGTAPRVFLP
jgi:hypothetical protein